LKKIVILRSHGGGGAWLNNLIYHLEKNNVDLPTPGVSFDREPTGSVKFGHCFEYFTPGTATVFDYPEHDRILFSTDAAFNLYLNESLKIQLNPLILNNGTKSFTEQFDLLTNTAVGWLSDPMIRQYYYTNIDLDYKLIFLDPEQFVDQLFAILDSAGLQYSKNRDYCLRSIKNYKTTCPNPLNYIGNSDSILWLAWCHGLKMLNKLDIPFYDFGSVPDIAQAAQALTSIQSQCIQLTAPVSFAWHD